MGDVTKVCFLHGTKRKESGFSCALSFFFLEENHAIRNCCEEMNCAIFREKSGKRTKR